MIPRMPLARLFAAGLSLAVAATSLSAADTLTPQPANPAASITERRMESAIRTELAKIRQREEVLEKREMELKTLQAEVDKRLSELEKVRAEVAHLLQRKTEQEAAKVKNLSKIYEKMEPSKAASVIKGLDLELAVEILQNMKIKAAGRILDNLDAKTAATLSTSFPALARD